MRTPSQAMLATTNITLPAAELPSQTPKPPTPARLWNPRSLTLIVLAWLILHIGGLFTPGLLDDVDSIYIEIAREMLHRHDFVTPYIDDIRFFDKPPLMYWLAAGSMHLFGETDWAARLPLALLTLALFLATYALGNRLFATVSPPAHPSQPPDQHPDRAALYASLALATSLGPYLYTRFFIPDILLALWMTLAVHLFLIALDRAQTRISPQKRVPHLRDSLTGAKVGEAPRPSPASTNSLPPMLAFAVIMAASVLTKGLIGLVFPIAFALLYLVLTRQLGLLKRLHLPAATALFLTLAAPWHILADLRNPPIPLPPGLGLPAHGGWAWFYLFNEHIARFLSRRIPHDYGQTPLWLFWLFLAVWIMPWTAFLPGALAHHLRILRRRLIPTEHNRLIPTEVEGSASPSTPRDREAAFVLLLWPAVVVAFFSLSARQEYYSLPAIPALALMAGGLLARADRARTRHPARTIQTSTQAAFTAQATSDSETRTAATSALRWSLYLLVPICTAIATITAWFALTAPQPIPGADMATLLASNPEAYNLSLGHLLDLTGAAMGLFRAPLAGVSLAMLTLGPIAWLIRRSGHTFTANLTLAAAAGALLLCVHAGLTRFYPILGSKSLALAIVDQQELHPAPDDLILIDGELTAGSTLLFYTRQPVHVVNARVNGLWYGSFWPDSPPLFETDATLHQLWSTPRRLFLLTYNAADRTQDLAPFAPVHTLASSGGKTILTNR
jgi:4-amino-4-deoxy-L-arabinose transferase-like glycosyltransferase